MTHRFQPVGEKSQTDMLIDHFNSVAHSITADEARELYGIRSLSRRIVDLDQKGYRFGKDDVFDARGAKVTNYTMTAQPMQVSA